MLWDCLATVLDGHAVLHQSITTRHTTCSARIKLEEDGIGLYTYLFCQVVPLELGQILQGP